MLSLQVRSLRRFKSKETRLMTWLDVSKNCAKQKHSFNKSGRRLSKMLQHLHASTILPEMLLQS